ncbi:uncharacterized protein [Watersipora subatra]|uniref:uncharacterized protein n=1 Tax=Watersipora subatra TaxID=2589382 RepID=UPI00355B06A7
MIDMFGPYLVRGEVQKRASGKVYGRLFTDTTSRAVHIEPAFAYDTEPFFMALQMFTTLIGADKQLVMWKELSKESIYKLSANNGTTWKFSPADSPLRQEVANILNERLLGTLPSVDSMINILKLHVQLIGRPFIANPSGWSQANSANSRLRLQDKIYNEFWARWQEQYAPTMVSMGLTAPVVTEKRILNGSKRDRLPKAK